MPELRVPGRLVDLLLSIHGLVVYVEKTKPGILRVLGIDVDSTRTNSPCLKTMNIAISHLLRSCFLSDSAGDGT